MTAIETVTGNQPAPKRIYVKVVNAGEYAGIQGSPAGQGFYVTQENILVPNGNLSQFSDIKRDLKALNEELAAVDERTAASIADLKAGAEDEKADLIAAFKAKLQPEPEAEPEAAE